MFTHHSYFQREWWVPGYSTKFPSVSGKLMITRSFSSDLQGIDLDLF